MINNKIISKLSFTQLKNNKHKLKLRIYSNFSYFKKHFNYQNDTD